jgi:MATE family multidrug resistance protein
VNGAQETKDTDLAARRDYGWTKQTVTLAVPALLGMLVDPLLSLMDTLYVGRVGSLELAALGACTSLFHLAFNAFRATTAATTSLVAGTLPTHGNNNGSSSLPSPNAQAQRVTSISLWFGVLVGIAVAGTLGLVGNRALAAMGVPGTSPLHPASAEYLFTRCWAAPAVLFAGVAEGVFRGYGDTVVPLAASLTAAALNFVLDPVLMFARPFQWGVRGAAAATAASQFAAAAVYVVQLIRRRMLPPRTNSPVTKVNGDNKAHNGKSNSGVSTLAILRTILGANLAMLMKQGSLLLGWAYATARATRLGADHVAAHQVGLSVWLVFALLQDGAAVAAQVLMSRAYAASDRRQVRSLTRYMLKWSVLQGVAAMALVGGLMEGVVPRLVPNDPILRRHVYNLVPHLAAQQLLVSLTLVVESLAVGANQFRILAAGTAMSTAIAMDRISRQTSIEGIWSIGIVSLFVGRLLTAFVGCLRGEYKLSQHVEDLSDRDRTVPRLP